jgi:flavin reductase (DIM6/NTAB) family NADH-FMN oxidoreductase RutF
MPFTKLPIERANRLINHGPTILVTSKFQNKANIMTAAWCMPVSHKPPMVAVAVGKSRFSHELILESGEFAINIPHRDLLEVWYCGTNSGRTTDKFSLCGLTPVAGNCIATPLIAECLGAIECRLDSHPTAGDHTVMVGEVLAVWAKPNVFHERLKVDKEGARTLHHLGGNDFCLPGQILRI